MRQSHFVFPRGGWEAYQKVKSNEGSAGIDGQTIEDFGKGLEEESLQDLESNVVGQRLSTASQDSEDTEEEWRGKKSGHSDCGGSNRATGCEGAAGTGG